MMTMTVLVMTGLTAPLSLSFSHRSCGGLELPLVVLLSATAAAAAAAAVYSLIKIC